MLTLENLVARYGHVTALAGVSLRVEMAEFVCLIGANGAGKSTTLKTISGLVRAAAGRIRFDGEDIHGLSAQEILRRGIAHCPEGRRVFPYMTVGENLAMGAYVRRDGAAVAADLERVFAHFPILAERRRQAAGTLSGGEQQMLAVARALCTRPKVLLLDEPSEGLFPAVTHRILDTVADLRRSGVAVLLVEQQVKSALRICDRILLIENGVIQHEARASELAANPVPLERYIGVHR